MAQLVEQLSKDKDILLCGKNCSYNLFLSWLLPTSVFLLLKLSSLRWRGRPQMISSEVPIMMSKAVEIFVTELSLRAWLHTEESKRRTVQVVLKDIPS